MVACVVEIEPLFLLCLCPIPVTRPLHQGGAPAQARHAARVLLGCALTLRQVVARAAHKVRRKHACPQPCGRNHVACVLQQGRTKRIKARTRRQKTKARAFVARQRLTKQNASTRCRPATKTRPKRQRRGKRSCLQACKVRSRNFSHRALERVAWWFFSSLPASFP